MTARNLDYAIHDAKFKDGAQSVLTVEQRADILRLIGKGCRQETKEKLQRRLQIPLSLWKSYGIYSRVTLAECGANYICGQSWNDEMRTLRECILDK